METDQDFVSTRAAAVMLGVALRTVQLWVERGSLQAWKTVGGHRRVVRASVEKLVAERAAAIAAGRPVAEFRLLVVEDDPRQRRLYEQQVPSWRPAVKLQLARDGFEGLLKAGQFQPDLILCDLQMPGMDGFRMVEALRQDATLLAEIVVITALGEGAIRERGGLAPDLQVLARPVPLAQIRKLVAERSGTRANRGA